MIVLVNLIWAGRRNQATGWQGEDQQLAKEWHRPRRDTLQRAAAGRGAAGQPAGVRQPTRAQQRYFELVLYTLLSLLEVSFEVNILYLNTAIVDVLF